jgi:peptide/nickel transport system ATP-binding protein
MSAGLQVTDLTVAYARRQQAPNVVVSNVDLQLNPGQILGLAGESGCGKSTTALAAIGFPIPGSVRLAGRSDFQGSDLLSLPYRELRSLWGRKISYVAQDAALALSPLLRVERLLAEPLSLHLGLQGAELHVRALQLLDSVGLPDPERAATRYPHQFSGGQQQRIALAIAMACQPEVLILDEPTTGLDVTTQAQISRLIVQLVRDTQAAALYVSHDLALLGTICDHVAIMYAGEIVERSPADEIYFAPRHPYAVALLDAAPRVDETTVVVGIEGRPPPHVVTDACAFSDRCAFVDDRCRREHPQLVSVGPHHEARCVRLHEIGIVPSRRHAVAAAESNGQDDLAQLVVEDLRCVYGGRLQTVAVDGVSLVVAKGEVLGLVGESGSGKSTLLRAIAGLHAPDRGTIAFEGQELPPRAAKRSRELRRAIQLVFQNPDSSLNPRHTVATTLERPVSMFRPELRRQERRERVLELLDDVRLDSLVLNRYPHELSGGQKQRIALARAFAADPRMILCDEVVSALDVSVQASVLELLRTLVAERDVTLLFVTHDLAVVRSIADRVCVMRSGQVYETAATDRIFETPEHPYTRELLDAVPRFRAN